MERGTRTMENYYAHDASTVAYLSAEYLPGPHLANNLLSLGITEEIAQRDGRFLATIPMPLIDLEEEPGLGNGGLGRLASCYWIRWPPSRCPRSATASATSSASSTR